VGPAGGQAGTGAGAPARSADHDERRVIVGTQQLVREHCRLHIRKGLSRPSVAYDNPQRNHMWHLLYELYNKKGGTFVPPLVLAYRNVNCIA
jgi:hypothetical protein